MNTFCFSHHSVRPALRRLTRTIVSTSLLMLPLVSAPTAAANALIPAAQSNVMPSIIDAEQLHPDTSSARGRVGLLVICAEGWAPIGGTCVKV